MRRKDRQVTDVNEIISIISKCEVCRLGMVDGDRPYVVPMNYGYELCGGMPTLYFHCAAEGFKLDILRRNPCVCFEVDAGQKIITGPEPCEYSYKYESVIGSGRAVFIEEHSEKAHALRKIVEHYAGAGDFHFPESQLHAVTVFKIQAEECTGKRN